MAALAEELAILKMRLTDQMADELKTVRDLDRALMLADNELRAQIEAVVAAHLQRREGIAAALVGLAQGLGRLPKPAKFEEALEGIGYSEDSSAGPTLENDAADLIRHEHMQVAQTSERAKPESPTAPASGSVEGAIREQIAPLLNG